LESSMECLNCQSTKIETRPKGKFAVAEFCSQCFKVCNNCEGVGYTFQKDELGREIADRCACQDLQLRMTLFNKAQIPSQFYDSTFENFDVGSNSSIKSAWNTAKFSFKNYKSGKGKGLLFMGGVGVGKTRLVSTMLREYTLKYGIPSLFKEFTSLLSEIKSGYDKGFSESIILEKIGEVEILVIDELGKGRKSDWEITILDSIISSRYNMKKTTIFTTNYTDKKSTTFAETFTMRMGKDGMEEVERKETLKQRVHSRIYSRLKEMCDFIEMKGTDYRYPKTEYAG